MKFALTTGRYQGEYTVYDHWRKTFGNVFEFGGVVNVLGYDDAKAVLRDGELYSSKTFDAPDPVKRALGMLFGAIALYDGEEHKSMRAQLAPPLRPPKMRDLQPTIDDALVKLLEGIAQTPHADAIHDLALPLTTGMIGDLLDIPKAQQATFSKLADWFEPLMSQREIAGSRDFVRGLAGALALNVHTGRLMLGPATDNGLLDAVQGLPLNAQSKIGSFLTLYTGGYETTKTAIGNLLMAVFTHKDQLRAIEAKLDEPDLSAALQPVVDECLRFHPPGQQRSRVATADTSISGVPVREGQQINVCLGAANRDPEHFARPDVFDIERTGEPSHLGFGDGAHACIGWALATGEMKAVLGQIRAIRPAQALSEVGSPRSLNFGGIDALHIAVDGEKLTTPISDRTCSIGESHGRALALGGLHPTQSDSAPS